MRGGRAVAVLIAAVALSGCAAAENASVQTATGAGDSPVIAYAGRALDAVVPPPGAVRVDALPGESLRDAGTAPVCTPLVDLHREWTVSGTPGAVIASVQADPGRGIDIEGTGGSSGPDGSVVYAFGRDEDQTYQGMVVVEAVALGPDEVGLRADSEAIPPGARCTRS